MWAALPVLKNRLFFPTTPLFFFFFFSITRIYPEFRNEGSVVPNNLFDTNYKTIISTYNHIIKSSIIVFMFIDHKSHRYEGMRKMLSNYNINNFFLVTFVL